MGSWRLFKYSDSCLGFFYRFAGDDHYFLTTSHIYICTSIHKAKTSTVIRPTTKAYTNIEFKAISKSSHLIKVDRKIDGDIKAQLNLDQLNRLS